MSELESNTLYNAVRNSDKTLLTPSKDKCIVGCCCMNEKWCLRHTGIPVIKEYDENVNNCCTCLDCCAWCLEFRINKCSICKNQTNCYLCCFSIYFT